MQMFEVVPESGVSVFTVGATSLRALCGTLNLHNVCQINCDGVTVWEHPQGMPYGYGPQR